MIMMRVVIHMEVKMRDANRMRDREVKHSLGKLGLSMGSILLACTRQRKKRKSQFQSWQKTIIRKTHVPRNGEDAIGHVCEFLENGWGEIYRARRAPRAFVDDFCICSLPVFGVLEVHPLPAVPALVPNLCGYREDHVGRFICLRGKRLVS